MKKIFSGSISLLSLLVMLASILYLLMFLVFNLHSVELGGKVLWITIFIGAIGVTLYYLAEWDVGNDISIAAFFCIPSIVLLVLAFQPNHRVDESCESKGQKIISAKLYNSWLMNYSLHSGKANSGIDYSVENFCSDFKTLYDKDIVTEKKNKVGKAEVFDPLYDLAFYTFLEKRYDYGSKGLQKEKNETIDILNGL